MKIRTWHLFIISFILHLAVVVAIGHYKEPRLWENGGIALNLYEGRGFSASFSLPNEPTTWQAPGYPYLLYFFWKAMGQGTATYVAISVMQCLFLASMVWPMAAISARWFPRVPVWVVQLLTVVAPLYLWYGTRFHHTAIVMALHPWLLQAWLSWAGRGVGKSVWVGILTALAALFQPILLGVFGVVGFVRLVFAGLGRRWKEFIHLALAGVVVVLGLLPWTIRNYQTQGRLVLIKGSLGKELWMGNNPNATGTGYAIGGDEEITNKFPPRAFELRGKVREIELMDAMKKEAIEWIRENPGEFFHLTAKKIWWFWTLAPKDRVRSTGAAEALVFRGIYTFYWTVLVILTVGGLMLYRISFEQAGILVLFICFYSVIYGLTHVGQARFRGEIEYIFLPAAAGCLYYIGNLLMARLGVKPASQATD